MRFNIYLILFGVILLLVSYSSNAGLINKKDDPALTKVNVGVYLSDIDAINITEGSYELDFYLSFTCQPDCSKLNFQFANGKILSKEIFYNSPTKKIYKITASLNSFFDFRSYPFDSHQLKMIIEDKYLDAQHLKFFTDVEKTAIDKEIVLLGWDGNPNWTTHVGIQQHSPFDSPHSRYIFSIQVERPMLAGFLKMILPSVFIVIIGFLTLLVKARDIFNSLALASGSLVSMILLHMSIISSVPLTRYVTYIDGFVLINYLGLFFVLIQIVILMRLYKKTNFVKLENKFLVFTSTTWLTLQLINVMIFFLFKPVYLQ